MMAALLGTSCYVAFRIRRGLAAFFPKLKLWPVLTIFITLMLAAIVGFGGFGLPLSEGWKYAFGIFGSVYMGLFIYLAIFILGADLVMLALKVLRFSVVRRRYFRGYVTLTALILCCMTCTYGFINAQQIDHVFYEIRLDEGKYDISDLNLVMISDLHLGTIASEGRLEEIVKEINSLDPDVVCIAGDFFDSDYDSVKDPEAAIDTLKKIDSNYGTYACLGNHDAGRDFDKMLSFFEKAEIHLLMDEYVTIDDRLVLVGRLDSSPIGGFGGLQRGKMSDFFITWDPDMPVVVLDHNPANIDEYGKETDLILSGHTHKGHSFPVNVFTKFMYTVDHGYYRKSADDPHVVVTSGIGYWRMPIRVGTESEIVSIYFSTENK